MAYLDWNPAYDTGIRSIDFEHRRLVDLLNEVDCQIAAEADAKAITGTLGEFHALASRHLALEESILERTEQPGMVTRVLAHRGLLDGVRDIMDAFHTGRTRPAALPEQLKQWMDELMGMDAQVFPTLARQLNAETLRSWGLSR
jgi:hemerythrin-like metal-binding protein